MAFEVALLEAEQSPRYQQIADKAIHLNQLGLSNEAIARHLGVDGKTVAKALRWSVDHSLS
jgi:DNA-binding NarL/FixJ family response regulator